MRTGRGCALAPCCVEERLMATPLHHLKSDRVGTSEHAMLLGDAPTEPVEDSRSPAEVPGAGA